MDLSFFDACSPIEKVLSWMDLPDAERPTLFCAYLSQVSAFHNTN